MRPVFENTVAHEEIVFDIPHHALILAFGSGAIWTAGPRAETVAPGQVYKAFVETWLAFVGGFEHGALLVIHQHFLRPPAKIFKTADQPLVGVLGIFAVATPKVK